MKPSPVVRISPAEAHAKMLNESFTYIDVRTPEEFAAGRPAGAINIPFDAAFVSRVESTFAKNARVVIGCQTGVRSLQAARSLADAGFINVLEQRAGFDAARGPFGEVTEPGWSRIGLPNDP